jgi:hypothetical protein
MTPLKKTTSRNSKLLLLMVFVVAIGSVMYHAERWIPAMKQNIFASDTIPSKPLIDTQLPKQVATATFAMG